MHREEILSKILRELSSYPQINFIAEGGAKAFNRYDELSDIDLNADPERRDSRRDYEELREFF